MDDHNHRHAQCQYVHKVGGGFKDDGIGELNAPRIAGRLDSWATSDVGDGAQKGAQR